VGVVGGKGWEHGDEADGNNNAWLDARAIFLCHGRGVLKLGFFLPHGHRLRGQLYMQFV